MRAVDDNDSVDDDRLRSLLGTVLAACFGILPILTGQLDVRTTLVVAAIGAAAILPVWRHAGEPLEERLAVIPLIQIIIGPIVIGRLFSGMAILAYLGGWLFTLGLLRFVTGWRDMAGERER